MQENEGFIDEHDIDLVMGALANYAQTLRAANKKRGVDVYARLISRTDVLYRDLYRVRYGVDLPSKNEVN
jgi:hypothetical protein